MNLGSTRAARLLLSAALVLGGLPMAAQAYTYSVLIDSDNDAATGCTVPSPNGSMVGVDARLDATVSFEPLLVQTQALRLCEGSGFGAPQSLSAGHPVGVDRGAGPSDVVELGLARELLGSEVGNDWNLMFLTSSPLLGGADAAGPVLAAGIGVPPLPPALPRPAVIPAAGAWSLILLCIALGAAAAWTLRRHPGLMLGALMVGALSSAGVAWAAGYLLDGEIGDWDVPSLLLDPAGDTTQPEPQVDIRGVFAAREAGSVFFRFDVTEMRLPVLVPPFLNTSFNVDENSANNSLVGSINAAPGGLSTLLRFALASQTPSAGFSVDNATGGIRVADSSQLDFETRPSFSLDVVVSLQGATGFSLNRQVTITLQDVNEAPQIAAQAFSVFENANNGDAVGTVVAVDVDGGVNGQLSYSVVGGSGQTVFALNAGNGAITVADAAALSLAASPYSLQVQVSDGGTPALNATATMTIAVNDVNDAPSFTPGPSPVTVLEDSAPYSAGWATAISDGDGGTQTLNFEFTANSNPGLFAVAPAISATGVLSFTLAPDANGSADLAVRLRDNGGTANGGTDVSPVANFSISATAVNDAPSFVIPTTAPPVLEGAGAQTVTAFATAISAGPPDEAGQTLSFAATVTGSTGNLAFAGAPALAPNGTLTYAPQAGTSGTASVSVVLSDNGGTTNGGIDASAPQVFTIQVSNINDAPSFTPGPSPVTVLEDSAPYSAAWATDLNDNDGGIQALSFVVLSNSNPGLFSAAPALSPTGVLSFTPAANANGSASLSVALRDNGGTANGGVDQSPPVTLVLNVTAVNDAPSFSIPAAAAAVLQDVGAVVQTDFATVISAGPADESGQTLGFTLTVTGSTGNLAFAQAPAIDPVTGNLSFAAQNGTSGLATVSAVLSDSGGTANGGIDASAPQVFTIEVVNVNDAPSFTPGASPLVVLEDAGAYSAIWATDINDNDGGTQVLNFELTAGATTGNLSFATAPSISPTGVLSFTPAADSNGSASFAVVLRDNGGTALGGIDASAPVPLVIEVTAVNDAPTFTIPASAPSVPENAGAQSVPAFATAISAGPADESAQTLSFSLNVVGSTGNLSFTAPPTIDVATGALSYAAAPDSFGVATIDVSLQDNGGTANGGSNTSAVQTFTLEVLFVNNAPTFVSGGNVTVAEDSGAYNSLWATSIDDGDAGISQVLSFVVLANDNPGLFAAAPGISPTTGNLSFLPAANASGVANLSVVLQDNGGTANGGSDTSTTVNFSITVTPVNDPPTVVPPTNVAVTRHIGRSLGSASAESLLANVSDPADGAGAAPFSVTVQTDAATTQGGRVTVAADGSWSYQPPASAVLAADSFNFQVCDSGLPLPPACTTATATIALSGTAVWFVDASASASGADGTLARPFTTIAPAAAAAGVNGRIFVASGSYSAGTTLLAGQWLIGQGVSVVSATSFDSLFGLTPPAGSATRPAIGGTRPLITAASGSAITLATGNSLRGIEIGNTAGFGLVGDNFGTLTLGDNRISGSGQALSLTTGTLAEAAATTAFDQISSSSGSSNIVLSAVAGSANFGAGALSGAAGTAFLFSTGTATLTYSGSIAKTSSGRMIDIDGAGAANLSLSGDLTCSAACGIGAGNQGVRISGRTGGTINLSGASKVFTGTGTNPAVQLLNNTGATIAVSGGTNLGTVGTPLVGSALVASGGGTLSLNGEVSINTTAARSLQLSGMTLSGSTTGTITSNGALGAGTPAIDIQNSASPAGLTFGQQLIIDHDDAGESGGGINLTSNTGSYTFSSIARITSTNTAALRASNAGTLTLGNVVAGSLVNNAGIAIDVQNTTIGAAGLNAVSVQSLGGANGILLNTTGSTGALTITGNGGTCTSSATCTGGFIANTSSHGVQLTNTVAPSITRMRIENTGGNGVNGSEVNGFTFANGSIDGTGASVAANSANIAFNTTTNGNERNIYGAVSITNSSLSNSRHHGIELFNFNGTLSSVNISGNTLTSSTSAATSQGWGIGLIAFGSASTVANVTAANITNNVITNFPGGGGIQVQGGNANPAGSAGVMGTAGSPTNVINITGNRIAGASSSNRIGGEGIVALVGGRGQGNFNISNNGTVANPITNVTGIGISNSAFGLANVTSLIENNVIVANNSFAAQGIGGGLGFTFGVADAPQMTMTVRGNTISQTDGNGILLVSRDTNGTLRARVQNNTVAGPLGGVRQGIRIESGNGGAGENDTVCLDISGNVSAPSVGFPAALGIGLRKQGTVPNQFTFGVVGMTATGSPGVEAFVNGLNPAGGGALLASATSGFTNCTIP